MDEPLSVREIAENCRSHSYRKHVLGMIPGLQGKPGAGYAMKTGSEFNKKGLGVSLNIKSTDQFERHIKKTLRHPETWAMNCKNGRNIYYNVKTNTLIIQNNNDKKNEKKIRRGKEIENQKTRSSCYRLRQMDERKLKKNKALYKKSTPIREFILLAKHECKEKGIDKKFWKSQLQRGGYNKLHSKEVRSRQKRAVQEERNNRKNISNKYKKRQEINVQVDLKRQEVKERAKKRSLELRTQKQIERDRAIAEKRRQYDIKREQQKQNRRRERVLKQQKAIEARKNQEKESQKQREKATQENRKSEEALRAKQKANEEKTRAQSEREKRIKRMEEERERQRELERIRELSRTR